jgi:hypothetical protein
MTAVRLVVLVLLTVSLDLAVPFVPATGGLQWDDDEAMVQMRRPRLVRAAVAQPSAPRTVVRPSSPAPRALHRAGHVSTLAWRPLLLKPARASSVVASSPEPH